MTEGGATPAVVLWEDAALDALGARGMQAFSMADAYRDMVAKTGLDLSATIRLLDALPVFLSGTVHKQQRRDMAVAYAAGKAEQEVAVLQFFDQLRGRMAGQTGTWDVLAELAHPVWDTLRRTILPGKEPWYDLIDQLPDLFNPKTSLRKRVKLNDQLTQMLQGEASDFLNRLSLVVLGARPLTHSLALSVHALARAHPGCRLRDIPVPDSFPDSALRFVDRVAGQSDTANGCPYHAGERVRCVTFDESYDPAWNARNLYGLGAHVCLGRPISQFIWQQVQGLFAQSDKIIFPDVIEIENREPFRLAAVCKVRLCDG